MSYKLLLILIFLCLGNEFNKGNVDCGEWDDSCTSDECHYLFQQHDDHYTVHAYCLNGEQHAYGESGCMGPSWFNVCCTAGEECEGEEGEDDGDDEGEIGDGGDGDGGDDGEG